MPRMTIRRAFWIFALFTVLTTIADRILFVILPLYLIRLNFTATEIGLTFTGAAVVLALFRFLVGKLSDLKGRKGIMSFGLLADSVVTMFYPMATTVTQFSLIKGIKDVAYNFTDTMENTLLGDSFPREVRPRILSRLGTVFPLGRALAAIIGFAVVTYLSVSMGFYVAGISLFLAFLIITLFLREDRRPRISSYALSLKNISRPLFLISLVGVCNSLAFSIAYFPGFFVLANSLGLREADLFLMFLLTYLISSIFAWKTESWIRAHGKEAVLGISALGFGLLTMLYAFASEVAFFFIALLGVAISFYVFRISYKNTLLDSTDRKNRGEQVGFSKMLVSLGNIAGPLAGGLLIDTVSLQSAFFVAGSFGILGFLLSLWLRKHSSQ